MSTRLLLGCAIASAPFFCLLLIWQIVTRPFNVYLTPLSLLSLGAEGWIQIVNFIATGVLAVLGAVGIRRAWGGGAGGTWGPVLIGTFGLGLILAGIFHPDPGYGFPPGAPLGAAPTVSSHAMVHNAGFLIIMGSLLAACFVFARGFGRRGRNGWATYCVLTGIAVPALIGLTFATRVLLPITLLSVIGYGWVSLLAALLMRNAAAPTDQTVR
ncbi:DUF998 domain-containing protein [Sphingomonas sp.]|uniref:DUF998 domain-containing protein n=1 Tax=Sphingomonas sp. TaxID=28214 RepID=UPI0025D58B42|nr:DUF998 domain-containing protein [Sphingomonas sp.]MBV9529075.1 DUF998 domain-containing protein [Sphingomonas sp.]